MKDLTAVEFKALLKRLGACSEAVKFCKGLALSEFWAKAGGAARGYKNECAISFGQKFA